MDIEHISKFRQGEQGTVGLCKRNGVTCVYKLPKFMNFLTTHEYLIFKDIESLSYLPHFVQMIDYHIMPIHPKYVSEDPFMETNVSLALSTLFLEYIPRSIPFLSMLEDSSVSFSHCLSIMKQTLCAILFAQKQCSFVHYDLHAMNLLLRPVDEFDIHVYKLSEDRVFIIPTYGLAPVIIDYGFSYSQNLQNKYLCMAPEFTNVGIYSPTSFDIFADFKRFLISVSADIRESREKTKETETFRNIIKNIFYSQDVSWNSGWNRERHHSILSSLIHYIQPVDMQKSHLFHKYPHHCLDILTGLVKMTESPNDDSNLPCLRQAFHTFFYEFLKIEQAVHQPFYSMYFLRIIVCLLQAYRDEYVECISNSTELCNLVRAFQQDFETVVHKLVAFCQFKVNYEALMCSAYIFGDYYGAEIHRRMAKIITKQRKEYESLPVRTPDEIYAIIDYHFPLEFEWTVDHTLVVYDFETQSQSQYAFNETQCEYLNNQPVLMRAYHVQQLLPLAEVIEDEKVPGVP